MAEHAATRGFVEALQWAQSPGQASGCQGDLTSPQPAANLPEQSCIARVLADLDSETLPLARAPNKAPTQRGIVDLPTPRVVPQPNHSGGGQLGRSLSMAVGLCRTDGRRSPGVARSIGEEVAEMMQRSKTDGLPCASCFHFFRISCLGFHCQPIRTPSRRAT